MTSRHRGAKPLRRCELLGVISLLSPEYLLSFERWPFFAHHWYVACDQTIDEKLLAEKIDEKLIQLNDDYAVERKSALKAIQVSVLKENCFMGFMQSKGKVGGQHKFPRVLKGEMLAEWKTFIQNQA